MLSFTIYYIIVLKQWFESRGRFQPVLFSRTESSVMMAFRPSSNIVCHLRPSMSTPPTIVRHPSNTFVLRCLRVQVMIGTQYFFRGQSHATTFASSLFWATTASSSPTWGLNWSYVCNLRALLAFCLCTVLWSSGNSHSENGVTTLSPGFLTFPDSVSRLYHVDGCRHRSSYSGKRVIPVHECSLRDDNI